jgi:hypothetical protein
VSRFFLSIAGIGWRFLVVAVGCHGIRFVGFRLSVAGFRLSDVAVVDSSGGYVSADMAALVRCLLWFMILVLYF